MTGGGIGIDYSRLRPSGKALSRTGGTASGPIPLMSAINEIGRNVMQGGSRRSAIYASLNWRHEDIQQFLTIKNWSTVVKDQKLLDFNFPAPLDMTNISVNYDDAALNYAGYDVTFPDRPEKGVKEVRGLQYNPIFLQNVRQAMETGEPGFSFNFGSKQNETLRNACTEVTSEDDSDVCNLGSINMANIDSIELFKRVAELASKFLVCGTLRADLPYDKVYAVRAKNRRLGLGLMGIHEWLLKRHYSYEVTPELHEWLKVYRDESIRSANEHCDRFFISRPVAYRAIAPTGSIGILAGTTTGIEPLFAVAYKRRFLTEGTKWKYQYVVDGTADLLINRFGVKPESIESALDLADNYEKRIKFQADIQDYVDMSISSTINLPSWGTARNNEKEVGAFASTLAKYAPRLRGFTCYPDGSRGGQPLTAVPYEEALKHKDVVYEENDICDISGKGGSCGV
jgi:ribonucleoside-diphosphate reductase alpha chain